MRAGRLKEIWTRFKGLMIQNTQWTTPLQADVVIRQRFLFKSRSKKLRGMKPTGGN